MKTSDFAGHCGSPPALPDCSRRENEARKNGSEVTIMTIVKGNRKKACPTTSIESRTRLGSRLFTMSMRMCSFSRSVHDAQRRNMALKSTHWSSSQAFDDTPNSLRMVALAAEMRTAASTSQLNFCPSHRLTASMARLSLRRPVKSTPPTHPGRDRDAATPPCIRNAENGVRLFARACAHLNPNPARGEIETLGGDRWKAASTGHVT